MFRCLLVCLLLFMVVPALAADPAGRWALRAGDITLMVFEVEQTPKGWTGAWERPAHFESDGDSFSRVTGPVVRRIARSVRVIVGGVELTFDDPRPDTIPDVFVLRARDTENADISYIVFGNEPATLVREPKATTLGAWDPIRTYVRTIDRPTNIEMTAIFEADQAARKNWQSVDWKVVSVEDRARRERTQELLDAGGLRSGDDFYHAAFIFQHGQEASDFLKAHALAVIAAARGKRAATWIAAATLDRYLQSIGQPQIYGTQFNNRNGEWTQAPYQRVLLSDWLRQASNVPSLIEQDKQLLGYAKPVGDSEK